MAESGVLAGIGELSRPATVLIERVSDAVGGYCRPWQIERVARAEANAELIRAQARVEITELEVRALRRFVSEEADRQKNIESITEKAIPLVQDDAVAENVERDWLVKFFAECRSTSDEDMQNLWAAILAGEANSPGKYSTRTVRLLGALDKRDAELFRHLCAFCWRFAGITPLIYDPNASVYSSHGINFMALRHLDEIGLISYESLAGLTHLGLPKTFVVQYHREPVEITLAENAKEQLALGHVSLSQMGKELAPLCESTPLPDFKQYVIEIWRAKGHQIRELDRIQDVSHDAQG